jgi:hypothetical protein
VLNASGEGLARLKDLVEQTNPDVLIVDPWRLFLAGDENNAEDVIRGLKALSSLRESLPWLTIIIVHHLRKDRFESPRKLLHDARQWTDNISGHSALPGHVDAIFGLERDHDQDGDELIVFAGVGRNLEPPTIILKDDEDSLRFEVCEESAVLKSLLTPKELGIWNVAAEMKGVFGFKELTTRAGVTNKKAVSSMLKKMESNGRIRRVEKGAHNGYQVVQGQREP